MASSEQRGQTKRKSSELGQVFEVSDGDLSPEEAPPPSKLAKTSVAPSPPRNLEVGPEQIHEISDDSVVGPPEPEVIVIDDTLTGAPEPQALEEGEVPEGAEPPTRTLQLSVTFATQGAADQFRGPLTEFLTSLSDVELEDNAHDLTLSVYKVEGGTAPKTKRRRRKKHSETGGLFVVDATPSPAYQRAPPLRYQSSKLQIHEEPPEGEEQKERPAGLRASCFNCAEPHDLRSCPHPKNFQTINANRQKFQQRAKTTRYHLGDTMDKYGHLKPGKLTSEARKALRLKKNQLPSFIYKMRVIGYPPGWLEEAKMGDASELEMFDIEGRHVKSAALRAAPGLDPEKIVDYPGFNIPIEKPFKDEYKYYGVAPYSDKFHKTHMMEAFRLQAQDAALAVENQNQDAQIERDQDQDESAPSLFELQKQKETLIAEIQRAAETVPWAPEPEGATEATGPEGATTGPDDCGRHSVRESVFGTPILRSDNSVTRLPAADNFTKGVSAVIDFENLPNSIGKYEQMSDVLKKVRSTMKGLTKS